MKKLKIGFTLMEVLIAMGILGVIGTLLVPQLVTGTQKNEAGILLGNAVEQISLGVRNIIQRANNNSDGTGEFDTYDSITLNDLYGNNNNALIRGANLFNRCGSFFNTRPLNTNYAVRGDFNGGGNALLANINAAAKFQNEKNGTYYMIMPTNNVAQDLDTIIDVIVIDVNGQNNPNRLGKDVFMFGLTADGSMIPAGTQKFVTGSLLNVPLMNNGCANNNITNGLSCAARIVKDSFRIRYY